MTDKIKLIKVINKGTGAGGEQTNINGLKFEDYTDIIPKLVELGYEKKGKDYYEKKIKDTTVIFTKKKSFAKYMNKHFKIPIKNICKEPDEAFIIINNNNIIVKILEKKNQNVQGSVDEKLLLGGAYKIMYTKMLENIETKYNIEYAFCVSSFLQNNFESGSIKYNLYKYTMNIDDIKLFYGNDKDYFEKILQWIII
jgi:hypothetical protein